MGPPISVGVDPSARSFRFGDVTLTSDRSLLALLAQPTGGVENRTVIRANHATGVADVQA